MALKLNFSDLNSDRFLTVTEGSIKGLIYNSITVTAPKKVVIPFLWKNTYKFVHFKLKETGAKAEDVKLYRGFGFRQAIPETLYSQAYKIIKEITLEEKEKLYDDSVERGSWMDDVYMTGQSDEF
jgi:hypothetical protein